MFVIVHHLPNFVKFSFLFTWKHRGEFTSELHVTMFGLLRSLLRDSLERREHGKVNVRSVRFVMSLEVPVRNRHAANPIQLGNCHHIGIAETRRRIVDHSCPNCFGGDPAQCDILAFPGHGATMNCVPLFCIICKDNQRL